MEPTSKTGVYTRTKQSGEITYVVTFTRNGKSFKKSLGTNTNGWTVIRAEKERYSLIHAENEPEVRKIRMTLNMMADAYLESIAHKSDHKNTAGRYNNHIKDALGSVLLHKIEVTDVVKLKNMLSSKKSGKTGRVLAPKYVDDMINLINTIYNYHNKIYRENKIASPADFELVSRSDEDNSRTRFLSREEYNRLLWFIKYRNDFVESRNTDFDVTQQLILYTKLLVTTGVRTYSALTIRVKDVDFEAGTIRVKNHKSNRIYQSYIHKSVQKELEAICNTVPSEYYIFGRGSEPLHRNTLNRRLLPIMHKVFNEHVKDRREAVVVHTLRHTFGSWLAQQGTSLYVISKLMDHTTVEQTSVYAKLLPDSGSDEVARLLV